jgi:O-antigen ligase
VPEYIKALIVILGLSIPIFWIARKQVCDTAVDQIDFDRRRNLWVALTVCSFLTHNFWMYVAISCVMILYVSRKEKNEMALFLFVAFAVPPIAVTIPGFGGIQQIFSVSPTRILVLLILAPAYIKLRKEPGIAAFGKTLADKFLLGYIVLPLVLQINVDTFTNTIRFGLYSITDIFLPYYVASRGIKTLAAWRDTLMSFTVAVALLSAIAIFESTRNWLLYGSVSSQMGIDWDFGQFMLRADSLRAMATAGHAIVLGYILIIGFAFYATSRSWISSKGYQRALGLAIVFGLIGTAARGPWVGVVAVILTLILTGKNITSRIAQLALAVGVSVSLLSLTTWGTDFLAYLPFVGTAESESVQYRQRLFDVSVQVIGLNPIFGSFDYMRNPLMQQMMQGEGIIDLVNSYLGIALTYGLVGLGLFLGVFLAAAFSMWQTMMSLPKDDEMYTIGRSLFACLAGTLVTIGTASSVTYIALLYWIIAGLSVGYVKLALNQTKFRAIDERELKPMSNSYRGNLNT